MPKERGHRSFRRHIIVQRPSSPFRRINEHIATAARPMAIGRLEPAFTPENYRNCWPIVSRRSRSGHISTPSISNWALPRSIDTVGPNDMHTLSGARDERSSEMARSASRAAGSRDQRRLDRQRLVESDCTNPNSTPGL